jgi:hypothetical protein
LNPKPRRFAGAADAVPAGLAIHPLRPEYMPVDILVKSMTRVAGLRPVVCHDREAVIDLV